MEGDGENIYIYVCVCFHLNSWRGRWRERDMWKHGKIHQHHLSLEVLMGSIPCKQMHFMGKSSNKTDFPASHVWLLEGTVVFRDLSGCTGGILTFVGVLVLSYMSPCWLVSWVRDGKSMFPFFVGQSSHLWIWSTLQFAPAFVNMS